jgi:hypothetical protein
VYSGVDKLARLIFLAGFEAGFVFGGGGPNIGLPDWA